MTNVHQFDFCVLGAGSAGYAAATTARDLGKSVALVDWTGPLAGLCILRGCMPSKTLLRSAEVAHLVKTAPDVGIEPDGERVNFRSVMERKRRIIKDFADYRVGGIETFPLFRGEPRFASPSELSVNGDLIRADKFLISTGSVINVPEIPGLGEAGYITSDDVLELDALPASVLVLGGGASACELAQYFSRLGVRTTMLQRSAHLMSGDDPDVGECIARCFEGEGIHVHTGTTAVRVERDGRRKRVIARSGRAEKAYEGDEIFLALGRVGHVRGFGFDAAGVECDSAGVRVDEYLRTTNPNIYAAGDVTGIWEIVHVAVYQGQLAARNAFSATAEAADYSLQSARALFTDPQVGIAGLSERDCRERGMEYHKATYPFDDLGKAISTNQTKGFVKMLAAPDGQILGVTIVGPEASDLIHEAIALLYFRANVRDVVKMPHLHPTLAEIMTYPAEELCERLEHESHVLVRP